MNVLITGDSHTAALQRGKALLVDKGEWPQEVDLTIRPLGSAKFAQTPFFIDRGDYAEITNEVYRKQFKRFPPLNPEAGEIIFGLSALLHGLRAKKKEWTEFVPSQLVVNEAPVSDALLDQVALDSSQYLLKFVDVILRTQKKLFVIEAPMPFKHSMNKAIRPEVFSYVNHHHRDFVRQELKRRNVPIIAVSPKCYDEAGFMREDYRHESKMDPSHGNAKFGELMMKKILDFLLDSTQP